MPRKNATWEEYKKLVLFRLDAHGEKLDSINSILEGMKLDIGSLKVKAAIAGGIAGIVGTTVLTIVLRHF